MAMQASATQRQPRCSGPACGLGHQGTRPRQPGPARAPLCARRHEAVLRSATAKAQPGPSPAVYLVPLSKLSSVDDLALIWRASGLVIDVFNPPAPGAAAQQRVPRPLSHFLQRANMMYNIASLHLLLPWRRHLTLLAFQEQQAGALDAGQPAGSSSSTTTASNSSAAASSSTSSTATAANTSTASRSSTSTTTSTSASTGARIVTAPGDLPAHARLLAQHSLVGVANVTITWGIPDVADAAGIDPGAPFGVVTNMAVRPHARNLGIGRALLQACCSAAEAEMSPAARLVTLTAYKDNEAALRLYERLGFVVCDLWEDKLWLRDAEKGRPGKPRRLLMVRWPGLQLSGSGSAGDGGCSSSSAGGGGSSSAGDGRTSSSRGSAAGGGDAAAARPPGGKEGGEQLEAAVAAPPEQQLQ